MANQIFRDTLFNRIENCIREANSAILINHDGMTGEVREILISKVLNDLLPSEFKIGTGKIADSEGNLSNQSDIIIYNQANIPPILFDETKGIFPIESVAYVIEVKSTLNATELKTTLEKADNLAKLKGRKPHFVLFAFKSDLKDQKGDYDRMAKYLPAENPALNICCIVERLYAYYGKSGWQPYIDVTDRIEVISLVCGILNTLINWVPSNNNIVPGNYFITDK